MASPVLRRTRARQGRPTLDALSDTVFPEPGGPKSSRLWLRDATDGHPRAAKDFAGAALTRADAVLGQGYAPHELRVRTPSDFRDSLL
jgi:hypothetical protein